MKKLKQLLILVSIAVSMCALVGCDQKAAKQQWEYRVIHFDRDESNFMESALQTMGDEGWEYAGPLANNGMNAQFVAFKRPK
ncbi:MAG: hypothetical protein QF489_10805 [Planctomycetota bacterium]|jgi:hypothetical protein|nr:hypothetical protein [Planctomycetota bacterium]